MKYKKEIQDELDELSPFLSELKQKKTGMELPEHYFDFLTASVMEQVVLIPKSSSSVLPTAKPAWYAFLLNKHIWSGLAMTLLLLVTILFFRNQPISDEPAFAEISSEEAVIYIAAHLEDFEPALFTEGDFIEEIEATKIDDAEVDLYLEEIIEDLDIETLEELF